MTAHPSPEASALLLVLVFCAAGMLTQTWLSHQNTSLAYVLLVGGLCAMLPARRDGALLH